MRRSPNSDWLIMVAGVAQPGVTGQQVAHAVERVWLSDLRYRYREGHVTAVSDDNVVFMGVTQIAPEGFYVTVEATLNLTPDC